MTIKNLPVRASKVHAGGLVTAVSKIGFAFFILVASQYTSSFAGVNLSPHRAIYDLKLKEAHKRSGIKDLTGRMAIEITGSNCEGWSVNFRMVNDFTLSRGRQRLVDSRSTSWEAGDGEKMSFYEHEFIDNRPQPTTRLKASSKNHKVLQTLPKKLEFTIPEQAIFPVTHQKRLIEKARNGDLRDKSIVYDGADHDNIYQAITFIGKKHVDENKSRNLKGNGEKALLKGTVYWPVTVSYYSLKDKNQQDTPSQQIGFSMYDNGIAGDLTIDYGDFSMSGKLIHIDKLNQSKCDK